MLPEATATTDYMLQANHSRSRAEQNALAFCKPLSKVSSTGNSWNVGRWDRQACLVTCTRLLPQISSEAPNHEPELCWLQAEGKASPLGASL